MMENDLNVTDVEFYTEMSTPQVIENICDKVEALNRNINFDSSSN